MRIAKVFAAALVLLASVAGMAAAQDDVEPGTLQSHLYFDMGTGLMYTPKGGYVTQLAGDVYNNTNPITTILGGISSTDLNGTWGDRLATTGTGILQEQDITVFNPNTSTGSLLTASFLVNYFDGTTSAFLGGYTTGVVPVALSPGFFTIITISGLSGLNINLNTSDVIITQKVATRTGTATRLGVVLIDPPTIGTSANTMYISNSATAAGFYTVGAVNANVGYRVNVSQPVPADNTSWGSIKAFYKK